MNVGPGFVQDVTDMRRQLDQLTAKVALMERNRDVPLLRNHLAYVGSTAITAASGSTPGSGEVTLKMRDRDSGSMVDVEDASGTAITQDVYNYTETASGTSVYVWVGQDSAGTWWYLNEACS